MPEQNVLQRKKSLVIRRITKAAPIICTRFGVKRIGIFGSFARGEQTKKSDVDVLVDFLPDRETYQNYMNLYDFLEELCRRKVDLHSERWISPLMKPYIDKDVIWIER
ncbi:MAG: nucleotidyltransferase family protein [Methanoregula sp.]|nr:nucleotidyltransferase family protein [Methanoregula sp.]MDD5024909.1 nucleotidyltransferase family protein [Methanoregula sp.]MDD5188829.1 nucleotidyltransferase family protein [Methanoregula sp.]